MRIKSEKSIQSEWINPRETSKHPTFGMTRRCPGKLSQDPSGNHELRKAAKAYEYESERRRARAMMSLSRYQNWMR